MGGLPQPPEAAGVLSATLDIFFSPLLYGFYLQHHCGSLPGRLHTLFSRGIFTEYCWPLHKFAWRMCKRGKVFAHCQIQYFNSAGGNLVVKIRQEKKWVLAARICNKVSIPVLKDMKLKKSNNRIFFNINSVTYLYTIYYNDATFWLPTYHIEGVYTVVRTTSSWLT